MLKTFMVYDNDREKEYFIQAEDKDEAIIAFMDKIHAKTIEEERLTIETAENVLKSLEQSINFYMVNKYQDVAISLRKRANYIKSLMA